MQIIANISTMCVLRFEIEVHHLVTLMNGSEIFDKYEEAKNFTFGSWWEYSLV